MFERSIDSIKIALKKILGDDTEFFCDIHCSDPFDKKLELVFPVVAVHESGLYLTLLCSDSEGKGSSLTNDPEYALRVFKSYFFTKLPASCLLLLSRGASQSAPAKLQSFDFESKQWSSESHNLCFDPEGYIGNSIRMVQRHSEDCERQDLISRLSRMGTSVVCKKYGETDEEKYFVKKDSKWFSTLNKDSEKVFHLALFGGFFGLHRFYLGMFGSGLLYLFTFGLLGFGWAVDCIKILLGRLQKKGAFLLPLENKGRCAVKFLIVLALVVCVFMIIIA